MNSKGRPPPTGEILESVYETLRLVFDGPKSIRDLCECTGATPDVIRRRMWAAEKTGLIVGSKQRPAGARLQMVYTRVRRDDA